MLEWLGDVGGLFDGLRAIGKSVVRPFAVFALQTELLSKLFRKVGRFDPTPNDAKFLFQKGRMNNRMFAHFFQTFARISH